MNFADDYLQKHAIGEALIDEKPDADLNCIVAIPAYNESGLLKCLDSLFLCPSRKTCEVLVLINEATDTSTEVKKINSNTFVEVSKWIKEHASENLKFHVCHVKNLPSKDFGAGLARKLVMDEAIRRFNQIEKAKGIVASLDADTLVDKNYLNSIDQFFEKNANTDACSIYFEHPVEGEEFPIEVYDAIINYELHQRYYLQALRYTGYPYAHHTVGSSFAVRAGVYCKQGGMSKRQAGEDFYFIQKVAMQGKYADCSSAKVYPSPRPSDRVPFGTGPDIARQLNEGVNKYRTFNPELFLHLKDFFDRLNEYYSADNPDNNIKNLHPALAEYLQQTDFSSKLTEIKGNVASFEKFQQRFIRKFNMFWILKYLHFAEEKGVKKIEVKEAAQKILQMIGDDFKGNDKKELLLHFREMELMG